MMQVPINSFTPYPEVNAVLQMLLAEVQAVLGPDFVGLYLYGSLSSGDFNPLSSDIDFLVVTAGELPAHRVQALEEMHARIAASGLKWAKKLEGSYIPLPELRRYDPAHAVHPSIGVDWEFGVNPHGRDWVIQLHILRQQGVTLAGPPPDTLIDPVSPDDLRQAVLETLQDWWKGHVMDSRRLESREYQAFAVLTMCRALYTLQSGGIVSKPAAAAWAKGALPPRWTSLIERALAFGPGDGIDDVGETQEFIRFTLETAL